MPSLENTFHEVIYTIGYQRLPLTDFVNHIKKVGIGCLIDVRRYPYSQWTTDYNPPHLTNAISPIKYVHLPSCAPSKTLKKETKEGLKFQQFSKRYTEEIMSQWSGIASALYPLLTDYVSCFLCFERRELTQKGNVSKNLFVGKEVKCHRRLLAEILQHKLLRKGVKISIVHLAQR